MASDTAAGALCTSASVLPEICCAGDGAVETAVEDAESADNADTAEGAESADEVESADDVGDAESATDVWSMLAKSVRALGVKPLLLLLF